MPADALARFTTAISGGSVTPARAFDALAALAQSVVGAKLFTVTLVDPVRREATRVYSNQPQAYPVSGTKSAEETDWSRQVLGEGRTFVANDIDAIAAVFPDHALIASLGCESVINVPVTLGGRVIATVNCLDAAGHYTADRVAAAEALKLPALACLLLNERATATDAPRLAEHDRS
jgi:GAF domain-containing protein